MTANEQRKHRYDSLVRQARALRAEAARGFTDNVYHGRILATAQQISRQEQSLISCADSQGAPVSGKFR